MHSLFTKNRGFTGKGKFNSKSALNKQIEYVTKINEKK